MNFHCNKDMNRYTIFQVNKHNVAAALLGLLLIVISCQREDIQKIEVENTPIEFSGITSWLDTKADGGSATSVLPSNNFIVWAQNSSNYSVLGSNGTVVSTSDGGATWTYSPVRYWQNGTYNFYAVSPADKATGTLSSAGLVLSFGNGWNLSTEQPQTDLLIAKQTINGSTQVNKDGGPNKVSLTFDHMLSKISFSARNAESSNVVFSVTRIKVYGLHKTAERVTVSSSSSTWSLDDNNKSTSDSEFKDISLQQPKQLSTEKVTENGVERYKYTNLCDKFIVFPETATIVVEVTYNQTYNGATASVTKSATISPTLAAGYEYDFKLKINADAIAIDSEPTVTPWVSKDSNNNDLVVDDPIEM